MSEQYVACFQEFSSWSCNYILRLLPDQEEVWRKDSPNW